MGLLQGYSIGSNALRNLEIATSTTAEDISQANNPNHVRKALIFRDAPASLEISGKKILQLANGLGSLVIKRIHNQVIDANFTQAQSKQSYLESYTQNLGQIESVLIQNSTSEISQSLDQFFNAASYLSSNPGQYSARLGLQSAGINLTNTVQGSFSQLQDQLTSLNQQIVLTIDQINDYATEIKTLNEAILKTKATGADASAMIDQRNGVLQELSQLMGFQALENAPDVTWVLSGQLGLVTGTTTVLSTAGYSTANQTVSDGVNNYTVTSGKLLGLLQSAAAIQNMQGQLNTLANNLKTEVNTIHETGTNSLGQTNIQFFNDVLVGQPQTGASDFSVNAAIIANPEVIASGVSGNPGDGGVAFSLSTSRSQSIISLGNTTFNQYTRNFTSSLGEQMSSQKTFLATQEALLTQLQNQKDSISGVSIDESMLNLIRYQRSLQAIAEMLKRTDQITDNMIRMAST